MKDVAIVDDKQRGVALIAVVWMVAALSLIIVGVVQSVRQEIRIAATERQSSIATALGDAAILLALQNMQQTPLNQANVATLQAIPVTYGDRAFSVRSFPLNGLIDINKASVTLLEDLYRYGAALPQPQATAFAQSTVQARQIKDKTGAQQGFAAVEDLLNVPGMTYDLYVRLASLLTADLRDGSGLVNPRLAPLGVLRVLAGGDEARALALLEKRKANGNDMDSTLLKPQYIDGSVSGTRRLQVDVALTSGGILRRTWLVQLSEDSRSGLPWRRLGSEKQVLSEQISTQAE